MTMKAKAFLIALIAIFSVLTVNAEDGDEQTDENTIETSPESTTTKPHYAPRFNVVADARL